MSTVSSRPNRDTRLFSRTISAILMPIGPAAIALLRLFAQDDTRAGELLAADSGEQIWLDIAGWIALFTLVPGVYAALHLTRRYRPLLTIWTGAFLVPAYLGMTALVSINAAAYAGIALGLSPQTASELGVAAMGAPAVGLPVLVFVVGHIVGTVLLGILVVRARLVSLPWGILLAVSQPIHLVATVLELPWLDFVGWGATAAGMAALAVRVVRTPIDEWDLPPHPLPARQSPRHDRVEDGALS